MGSPFSGSTPHLAGGGQTGVNRPPQGQRGVFRYGGRRHPYLSVLPWLAVDPWALVARAEDVQVRHLVRRIYDGKGCVTFVDRGERLLAASSAGATDFDRWVFHIGVSSIDGWASNISGAGDRWVSKSLPEVDGCPEIGCRNRVSTWWRNLRLDPLCQGSAASDQLRQEGPGGHDHGLARTSEGIRIDEVGVDYDLECVRSLGLVLEPGK